MTYLLWILLPMVATAFPTSIGSCLPGIGAINQGAHANLRQLGGGDISDAGFQVLIDGRRVYPGVRFDFTAGVTHSISLVATQDFMRGFLMRIQAADGQDTRDSFQSTDSKAQIPWFCTDVAKVGGLAHKDNKAKTSIQGTLYIASPSLSLSLDVTTVVSTIYSYGLAEWYVSQFNLRAVAKGTTITNPGPVPTAAPAAAACKKLGAVCTQDGACCTGRCIRSNSPELWATGTCQSTGSTQGDITLSPPAATGRAKGAACDTNSHCASGRCNVIARVCASNGSDSRSNQKLSKNRGGASGRNSN